MRSSIMRSAWRAQKSIAAASSSVASVAACSSRSSRATSIT
jgi:hypothetical protein